MNRLSRHLLLGLALASSLASKGRAQAGVWVFDGWPHEKNGYFAGQTEVLVDGARVRITEWPEDEEDLSLTLVTYHLGTSVLKVFPWNGERVALVFEADAPMPFPKQRAGQLLPRTFPCSVRASCHVATGASITSGTRPSLDPAVPAPGSAMSAVFVPDPT